MPYQEHPRDKPANLTRGQWFDLLKSLDDEQEIRYRAAQTSASFINKAMKELLSLAQLAGSQLSVIRSLAEMVERLDRDGVNTKQLSELDQRLKGLEMSHRQLWQAIGGIGPDGTPTDD